MSKPDFGNSSWYAVALLLAASLSGCEPALQPSAEAGSIRIRTAVKDPTAAETIDKKPSAAMPSALKILDTRCLSCHIGVAGAPAWGVTRGADEATWLAAAPFGLIVPGKPDSSRLIARMIHAPVPGDMPPGATAETFPRAEYEAVYAWIVGLPVPDRPADAQPDLAADAIAVLDGQCLTCHVGVGAAPNWGVTPKSSASLWLATRAGLIVPGKPQESELVTRMIHAPLAGNMPPDATAATFPRSQYDAIVAWIGSLAPITGGGGSSGNGGGDGSSGGTGGGGDDRPAALQLLDSHCMNCHNGSGAPTNWGIAKGASEAAWLSQTPQGLIIPGNAADSRLVRFMIYSTNGSMPEGATVGTFPRAKYDAIVAWINGLPPTTTDPAEEPQAGESVYVPGSSIRLGDRNFVADILSEVLGQTTDVENIRGQLLTFGGPCPTASGWTAGAKGHECVNTRSAIVVDRDSASFPNNANNTVTNVLSYNHVDVVDMATSSAAVISTSTVVREGSRTLACERALFDVTYNNAASSAPLLKALQKISDLTRGLAGQASATLDFQTYPLAGSIPTDAELKVAHMLFYNFQEPTSDQLGALRTLANRAKQSDVTQAGDWPVRFEPWRYVLFSLCQSPDWQIP